jgi:hypothetical protein
MNYTTPLAALAALVIVASGASAQTPLRTRDTGAQGVFVASKGLSQHSRASLFAPPGNAKPAAPRAEASSSGWIHFTPHTNFGIYLPVEVEGRETMALLYGGPSAVDTSFAASLGLEAEAIARGAHMKVGRITLPAVGVQLTDMRTQTNAGILGRPALARIGEEVFNQWVVDIDFAHHRVAFRDPGSLRPPAGAIEIPLLEVDGERVVSLSIDGAAPVRFELELGNVTGPLLVTPAYAQAQRLFDGRPTSQRLSGRYSETTLSLDHLAFAGVDFRQAPIAIVPETELPPPSIVGGVGLPLLAKFRLIIDYPHNRLFAIPNSATVKASIAKDRIGLVLARTPQGEAGTFGVAFVSPGSPADAAGFKKGDKIALIDGKPFKAWRSAAVIGFQMADAGAIHVFTMPDGATRRVRAADFF